MIHVFNEFKHSFFLTEMSIVFNRVQNKTRIIDREKAFDLYISTIYTKDQ